MLLQLILWSVLICRSLALQSLWRTECPRFVHGELRHSLMPIGGDGGSVRFDYLLQSSDGDGGFWTGSIVTASGAAASGVRVVAPQPSLPSNRNFSVCGTGGAATVASTAAAHGCAIALNAGLFEPSSGSCRGNLVSDGAALHHSGGVKNAHFGVTNNGELFFGYLTVDQLQSGMFKQLVGGVIWLVRNGTSYVEESINAECSSTQTTGSLRRFATVVSARSAIGQRPNGDLVLVRIVGKTDVAGINLFQLADLLIDMGVYNAINLDGGGSSTMVVNGTVVGGTSDFCPGSPHLSCQRPVTSIICLGDVKNPSPGCGPCNPSGGACVNGSCRCLPQHSGPGCYQRCSCLNSAACHPQTGNCLCPAGYRGRFCESRCARGFYGQDCAHVCVCAGADQANCHHVNGTCSGQGDDNGEGDGYANSANGAYNLLMLVKRRLSSLHWAVAILPSLLAASCLLNVCLLVRHCRLRRTAGQMRSRWRQQRHRMRRLAEPGSGGSGDEAGLLEGSF